MKIIKIILLIAVVLFSLPLHGMAEQHEDESSAHHCVLACHTCCQSAILAQIQIPLISAISLTALPIISFSYQPPFLDISKRPPVVSA